VPPSGLWFGGGGRSSDFLVDWRVIVLISVYSSFSIGSGEYCCFCHPNRFLVDIKLYEEDWGVFIFRVCPIKCVGFQPSIYVLAGLFCGEGFYFIVVDVVDSVVEEVLVAVNCYYV